MFSLLTLLAGLALILGMCSAFTNAVECLGKRYNLGSGAVGSVLAAVGTALPETMVPVLALLVSSDPQAKDVGIGAIAGAPFMLATLGFAVTGIGVIAYALLGRRQMRMAVDLGVIKRDLCYFLGAYGSAVAAAFIPVFAVRVAVAVGLLITYLAYVRGHFEGGEHDGEEVEDLYLSRLVRSSAVAEITQAVLAIAGILLGAWIFIGGVSELSSILGASALIVSMIVTPIATELPEKFNSLIWTGRGKDTLALGNMTGAMVFQSCFPVAFGLVCSPWVLSGVTLVSAVIALLAGALTLAGIVVRRSVNPIALASCGVLLYAVFITYVLKS